MRLIDADKVLQVLDAYCDKCSEYKYNEQRCGTCPINDVIGIIKDAIDTNDEHGKWIEINTGSDSRMYQCSVCGQIMPWKDKYCCGCGRLMNQMETIDRNK